MTLVRFALLACALVACSRKTEGAEGAASSAVVGMATVVATAEAAIGPSTSTTSATVARSAEPAPLTDEQRAMVFGKAKPDDPLGAMKGERGECNDCVYDDRCHREVIKQRAFPPERFGHFPAPDFMCCSPIVSRGRVPAAQCGALESKYGIGLYGVTPNELR